MAGVKWTIKGREFNNCSCAYGCPCQFNALPTYNYCKAIVGIEINKGHHGKTKLDGLKVAAALAWPGPIHHGKGEAVIIIDQRASPAQREALLRILSGQDTEPGATIFQVFSTTLEKVHDPVFAPIEFEIDIGARKARLAAKLIESRGEPILNPVTKQEHRVRINLPHGFEYVIAEAGRGWSKTSGPLKFSLEDSHAHFANLHMTQSGVVR